jgi:hypothetical protein
VQTQCADKEVVPRKKKNERRRRKRRKKKKRCDKGWILSRSQKALEVECYCSSHELNRKKN